jgi:hypothetical protein
MRWVGPIELLAESAPVSSSIRPALTPAGGQLALRGSLAEGAVARELSGGLWLGAPPAGCG